MPKTTLCRALLRCFTLFALLLAAPPSARAEVERVEVLRQEGVAGGHAFGLAGPYEKRVGRVHFALDPDDPANARIVDLTLAPRDPDGKVRFSADFYALRPVDPARGNGTVLVEVPNRGGKASIRYFDRGARRSDDPSSRADFGDGLLFRRGMSVVWLGWQFDVPEQPGLLRLDAVYTQGTPLIAGLVRADHVFSKPAQVMPLAHRQHRPYRVADPDDARNVLTVRDQRLGARTEIARDRWRFARLDDDGAVLKDRRFVYLPSGFEPGRIYELVYVAERPAVAGLGLAAMRDFASYLKHDPASPAPGARTLAVGISQTGRFLRTFLYQGFNRDLAGRRAFDGMLIHSAGAGRGSFNHRFAQPSRDAHPFSAFFYPTDLFPFSDRAQRDAESGRSEGLLENPAVDRATLPKIFFTNSGYEYWGRAAALIHTSVDGAHDFALGDNVRAYHLASGQHFVDRFPPRRSGTLYPANPANYFFVLRALLMALDDWLRASREPPPSQIPRLADATLVPPAQLAFPQMPGVRAPRQAHEAYRMDYGERFLRAGIIDREPPRVGPAFPSLVPQVDADGNELGGIRLPQIAVPVATYTPWNYRAPETGAANELADFRGSFLPFAADEATRAEADTRPSLAARYGSRDAYLGRYMRAAVDLVRHRLLLDEDLPEILDLGSALWDQVHDPPAPEVAARHVRFTAQPRPGAPSRTFDMPVRPSPTAKRFLPAEQAPLDPAALVLGVVVGTQAVAYPIEYLAPFEIVNGVAGGAHLAATW